MVDNASKIKQAFEQPQWYLQRTAYNIGIRAETVLEYITEMPESVLDIGCGDGSLSRGLLNGRNRLTLLDQSQTMLDLAHSRIPKESIGQVETVNANFTEAQLKPQSFDLILCVGVLAYIEIEARPRFIERIKSLLKPGGSLIIECTDGPHFINRLVVMYRTFRYWLKPNRMRTVVGSSAQVVAICKDLGFDLAGSFRYCLPLPLMGHLMSQSASYRAIRSIFGTAAHNRNAFFGNECIYHFKLRR
jgi:2-polyprenyl-3-methyl-5-hydroxy-6-metoxy-1,4-benzoquinol methylase